MKILIIATVVITFFSLSGYSQDNERYQTIRVMEDLMLNKTKISARAQGIPYANAAFLPAVVGSVNLKAFMRYDVYKDQFEFVNVKDTLVLVKSDPYISITFTGLNTKYKLLDYNYKGKSTKGYLISLFENNNFKLYKKQNITFYPETFAKSGYDNDTPPRFQKEEDTFFLEDGQKGIFEFPTNKKGLLKLYPERKDEIETFIKQNRIDFDKEQDLVKLVNFLAT